jgi:hypothetical protein
LNDAVSTVKVSESQSQHRDVSHFNCRPIFEKPDIERYAIRGLVNNIADTQTYEVGAVLTPLSLGP